MPKSRLLPPPYGTGTLKLWLALKQQPPHPLIEQIIFPAASLAADY